VLKKFFKSEKIRESLSYQCFYAGLPPELLPGLYADTILRTRGDILQ